MTITAQTKHSNLPQNMIATGIETSPNNNKMGDNIISFSELQAFVRMTHPALGIEVQDAVVHTLIDELDLFKNVTITNRTTKQTSHSEFEAKAKEYFLRVDQKETNTTDEQWTLSIIKNAFEFSPLHFSLAIENINDEKTVPDGNISLDELKVFIETIYAGNNPEQLTKFNTFVIDRLNLTGKETHKLFGEKVTKELNILNQRTEAERSYQENSLFIFFRVLHQETPFQKF
jgi:hypothetical protein